MLNKSQQFELLLDKVALICVKDWTVIKLNDNNEMAMFTLLPEFPDECPDWNEEHFSCYNMHVSHFLNDDYEVYDKSKHKEYFNLT